MSNLIFINCVSEFDRGHGLLRKDFDQSQQRCFIYTR